MQALHPEIANNIEDDNFLENFDETGNPVDPKKKAQEMPTSEEQPIEEPDDYDEEEKDYMRGKIERYKSTFPQFLSTVDISDLENARGDELEAKLKKCADLVNRSNQKSTIDAMIPLPFMAIEEIMIRNTPAKIKGFTSALMSDEQFKNTLHQAIIENDLDRYVSSDPIGRICFKMIQTGMMLHMFNSNLENMTPEQKETLRKQSEAMKQQPKPGDIPDFKKFHDL
jgi:hypothetical protein